MTEFSYLSFRMPDEFFENYKDRVPKWGFPIGGGNTLGEHSWLTKYARRKADGGRERYWEGLRRVIEGMYSIQKDHATAYKLPWNEEMAFRSASEAYERAFTGKWSPPGRGLWMMGTELVNGRKDSSALQNCAFVSTENLMNDPVLPFVRLMDMSMLGIGVGFDTRGAGKVVLHNPSGSYPHVIADSREGWCESVGGLLRAYTTGSRLPNFDYSRIRPAGSPIKTFGGVAAGPGPLQKCHQLLIKLLADREGEVLTSTDIVDIQNVLGKCVVSGNVRRSAEIALGDPGDEDFLNLKDWNVNPERMGADGWGHLSNNSVIATSGADYDHLVKRIELNGEPGIFWLDIAQNYGRLADPADSKEYRTVGVNPCLAGDTWIMTVNGPRQIKELCDDYSWSIVDGNAYWTTPAWSSGIKEIFKLTTSEGYEIVLTENHKVRRSDGSMIEAYDLIPGDEISIGNQRGIYRWDGAGSWDEGYLCGLYRGDGGIEDKTPVAKVWDKDDGSDGIASEALRAAIESGNQRTDWSGWRDHGRGYRVMSLDRAMIRKFGLYNREKSLGPEIEKTSADFHRGFLRGFFDTDSHVQHDSEHSTSIQLSQSDREALIVVQRMLLRMGVKSAIYRGRPEQDRLLPDGKGGLKSYHCKAQWRLYVTSDSIPIFNKTIGYSHSVKAEKLEKSLIDRKREFYTTSFTAKVQSLEYAGEQEVYDQTVSRIHIMEANGIIVANCGEQPLEDMELCTLVESFPSNCSDIRDYLRTLKFAYLYGKTVTLLMTRWPETNAVMCRNRRIGTSMTGIAQFAEKHGWAELRRWQEQGYSEIRKWDKIYSEWLGVRESIRVTTVKPSGTVSLLHGVTPGAHWPRERGYYVRTVREMKNSLFAKAMEDAGYPVEPSITDPDTTVVITMPAEGPDIRPEREVSIWEKASLAAMCQRYWSDNAVSVTITFREDEVNEVPAVLRAFDGQLKSVSFLPMAENVYAQAPYQRVSREEWDALRAGIRPLDWSALYSADNETEPEGELYCTTDFCEIPKR